MSAPLCPRCGYDQAGLIATWAAACPVEYACTECGGRSPSAWLFEPGPAWSVEHARRRLLRRWAATTFAAHFPIALWRGLRPEDTVQPRRLVLMAASWLLLLYLTAGVIVAAGTLVLVWSGNAGAPYWETPLEGAWALARQVANPLAGYVRVPMSPSSYFSDPMWSFLALAALPHCVMAAFFALARNRRARHAARAAVHALATTPLWLCVLTLTFAVAIPLNEVHLGASVIVGLSFLGLYAWGVGWWWSRFQADYLGRPARLVPVVLRTVAAFVVTFVVMTLVSMVI